MDKFQKTALQVDFFVVFVARTLQTSVAVIFHAMIANNGPTNPVWVWIQQLTTTWRIHQTHGCVQAAVPQNILKYCMISWPPWMTALEVYTHPIPMIQGVPKGMKRF